MIKFYNEANFDRDNDFFCCSVGGEKYTVSADEDGKIEIPAAISKVENSTRFFGNKTLKELVVPANVKSLSIQNCVYLQKISLAMKVVPAGAFDECGQCANKLELVLQEGVEEVKRGAFNNCHFDKIVLPASIKKFPLDAVVGTVCEIDFKNVCDKIVDMEPVTNDAHYFAQCAFSDSKSWLGLLQNYPEGIYLMDNDRLHDKNFVKECKKYIVKGMEMRRRASQKSGDAAKREAAENIKLMKDIDEHISDIQFDYAQREAKRKHNIKTHERAQQYYKLDYSAAREKFLK